MEGAELPFPVDMFKLSTENMLLFRFHPWLEVRMAMNIPVTYFILIWFVLSKWFAKWLFLNPAKQVIFLRDGLKKIAILGVKIIFHILLTKVREFVSGVSRFIFYGRMIDVWRLLFIKRCCWIMLEILVVLAISVCILFMA